MSLVRDLIYALRNRQRNKVATIVLGLLSDGQTYGTAELVEELFPEKFALEAGGDAITLRKDFFKELLYLAEHQLKGWATKGEPKLAKRYGKEVTVRPWIWAQPMNVIAGPSTPDAVWEEGLRCLQRWSFAADTMEPDSEGAYVRWSDIEELLLP